MKGNRTNKIWLVGMITMLTPTFCFAQISRYTENIEYRGELSGELGSGDFSPLWLQANKFGLSSSDPNSGYLRGSLIRDIGVDSLHTWGIGYGADIAVAKNFTSTVVIQQLFADLKFHHGRLTVGSKEYPMELKNNSLSSGSQTFGINARPVPQVRIALPEYWTLPILRGWVHLKGHISYGKMTDQNWQHDFTGRKSRYTDGAFYHSKAGYIKIGNDERYAPLSLELGLEMACQFGGTTYTPNPKGGMYKIENSSGIKDFAKAFIPGGSDATETTYRNAEGNHLGSWLMRLNYEVDTWKFGLYADKYFEDHSSMLQLDYNGYGTGSEWNTHKKRKYDLYHFKDMMLGLELNYKYGEWLRDIVFEYVYSKYQSGPIYHDHTKNISDHIGGNDNFYNHYLFPGWQHWGQVMGNPLYLSPIYNENGLLQVANNRFTALHLGISGCPADNLRYRVLATWQEGLGTYDQPYSKKKNQTSLLLDVKYDFHAKPLRGWSIKGACGVEFGEIRGDNVGFQLTISKRGIINYKEIE